MFSRDYYEAQFTAYPDLVTLKEMRKMLGGISEKKALGLLHNKLICSNNLTTSLPTLRTHSASAAQCERKAAYMNKIVIKIGDASRN